MLSLTKAPLTPDRPENYTKPIYHQSNLANWFKCPTRFDLSLKHKTPPIPAMQEGNLLEGYVFGFKPTHPEENFTKGKSAKTLAGIRQIADIVRPIYGEGEPFVKIGYYGANWGLEGELDFIGEIEFKGVKYKGIIDLKFTGDIAKIWGLQTKSKDFGFKREWNGKNYKDEFLQSTAYPYMIAKATGEMIPSYYLVVENPGGLTSDEPIIPIIKLYKGQYTAESLIWFEEMVNKIHEDPFMAPNFKACFSSSSGECPFFKYRICKEAIEHFEELEIIHIDNLSERGWH